MAFFWKERMHDIPTEPQWYNLETGRRVIHIPKGFEFDVVHRITGPPGTVQKCLALNAHLSEICRPCAPQSLFSFLTHAARAWRQREEVVPTSCFDLTGYRGPVKVERVLDGDTLEIVLTLPPRFLEWKMGYLPLQPWVLKYPIRLYGLDAVELSTANGLEAKQCLETCLRGMCISVLIMGFDKYGRLLGNLYRNPNLQLPSINTFLLQNFAPRLFRPYSGGQRNTE